MSNKILFTKQTLPFILKALGKKVTKSGCIKNKITNRYERDINGSKVKANKVIGFIDRVFVTDISQIELIGRSMSYSRTNTLNLDEE